MQAVVLAGGLGTRLRPVTNTLPKALVPIQGKPLTDHVLDLLQKAGVTEVYLAVGHLKEHIKNYYAGGAKPGLRIKYIEEDKPLGTGGWMHLVHDQLKDDFIVMNGDNLFAVDFKEMLALHQEQGALATIALTPVKDVSSFGIADLRDHRIHSFIEKPSKEEAPSNLASSGYYVFNEKIFDYRMQEEKFMLEYDLFPALAAKNKVCGFPSTAQWFDTGTFERLEQVEKEWKNT
ncbi:NDP-sugar synthase [Candidatus Woesearchaeota archaeon]|nr:NDP-sugar synthase [Candidatus Woesearchaeota archaeon]